jgi:hypothetical protein
MTVPHDKVREVTRQLIEGVDLESDVSVSHGHCETHAGPFACPPDDTLDARGGSNQHLRHTLALVTDFPVHALTHQFLSPTVRI